MYHKSINLRRHQRNVHIKRKKSICNSKMIQFPKIEEGKPQLNLSITLPGEWYKFDGMYDKGKIHCGCSLCKPTKRFRAPSFTDMKLINKAKEQMKEYKLAG